MGEFGSLVLSYAAGALSTLSPCALPLLPVVLFGVLEQHAWGPVALVAGLSASFAAIGIFVASFGFGMGLDPTMLRFVAAVVLVLFGITLLVPVLQNSLSALAAPMATGGQRLLDRLAPSGVGGPFLLGALLGAIWLPCSGPTLGAAIGLASQSETMARAALVMLTFALGASTPILILAYGSRQAVFARRYRLAQVFRIGKPVMGSMLVAVGAFVLTGLDKIVEASLTRAMPDWLVTATTRF